VLDDDDLRRLVSAAALGSEQAWSDLVDGLAGLVWSVARGLGLYGSDAADVSQTVWLKFVENIAKLREPERAPAWLATTTRHECLRVLRRSGRTLAMADPPEDADTSPADDAERALLAAEDSERLWHALGRLSPPCQRLLRLLATDPPLSYDDVSSMLGMPKGSIGPTRMRCIDRLRTVIGGDT
jgi:RNA polymerase sigma factor (sigma-70 family)